MTAASPPSREFWPGEVSKLLAIFTLVRYRFFLFAGILPYLLGAVWAFTEAAAFNEKRFWLGFMGIALAIVGVEAYNDYFDSVQGTDRVFNPQDAFQF